MRTILAAIAVLVAVSGCKGKGTAEDTSTASDVNCDGPITSRQFWGVDILVVVDSSESMEAEQARLVSAFPLLVESLLDPGDSQEKVIDLHIGVISTDMGTGGYPVVECEDPVDGDDGELLHSPHPSREGCEEAYPLYLSYELRDERCPVDPEELERLTTGFGCIGTLGTGCGFGQHLKAVARALIDHRDGINAGFLRPDSVLMILFVTDEDDCSVAYGSESIFDPEASLGPMDLRCFNHPEMVEPVETYREALESLRLDPDKLLLAFLVGVPPGSGCEGLGHEISGCLMHPDMQERVDPESGTGLVPSCESSGGQAFPPRRLVQVAQELGARALVRSVCSGDYGPGIEALTGWLQDAIDATRLVRELPTKRDEADPCRCLADCRFIEALSDLRECPAEKPCYRPEGPGTPCADPEEDPDGLLHTLCEIPQAGTRMDPCDPGVTDCNDAGITHTLDGEGWYYMGRNWTESPGDILYEEPEIKFTEGMEPAEGYNVYIQCESFICPENRQCGPDSDPMEICCEFDEYCAPDGSPECLPSEFRCCAPRPD